MKKMMILVFVLVLSMNIFAHGEGGDAKVGKGFAVEEYTKEKGFQSS